MIKQEILDIIDNIDHVENDQYVDTISSMNDYMVKENALLSEYSENDEIDYYQEGSIIDGGKKVIQKIFGMIKKIIVVLINQIKKFIAILSIKRKSRCQSVDMVLMDILNNSKYNKPDDIASWPIPKINPIYLKKHDGPKDKDKDVVQEAFKETPITNKQDGPVKVKMPVGKDSLVASSIISVPSGDVAVGFDNSKKTIRFKIFGRGLFSSITATDSDTINNGDFSIAKTKNPHLGSAKIALYLMTNDDDMKKLNDLVLLAMKVLKHNKKEDIDEFNNTCSKEIKTMFKNADKIKATEFEVSLSDLTSFQKRLNDLNYKMNEFIDIDKDVSSLDKATMKSMNLLTDKLLRIQIALNMLTSAIENKNIINANFIGCIKNVALLDLFVKKCIDEGIPPKYVGYNAWLVSDKCIKGEKPEFAPVWGQTRIVFFPPGKRVVYKVALSGAGITSNQAEIKTSRLFVDMDRVDLIAPIVRTWKNESVVAMECVQSDGKPSWLKIGEYTREVSQVIKDYEAKNKVRINTKISDQHKDNVKYDIKNGVYRSIDYGIAKRSL